MPKLRRDRAAAFEGLCRYAERAAKLIRRRMIYADATLESRVHDYVPWAERLIRGYDSRLRRLLASYSGGPPKRIDERTQQLRTALDDMRVFLVTWNKDADAVWDASLRFEGTVEQEARELRSLADVGATRGSPMAADLHTQGTTGVSVADDGKTAVCDGTVYPITEDQARVLCRLIDAHGAWVPSGSMKQFPDSEERPDRIIRRLPRPIQDRIESKTSQGFRLRLD